MDRLNWINRIKDTAVMAGTYKECFDDVIGTLAGILEKRDLAQEMFDESGETIIVEHTNKAGATNLEQNPTIRLINDLNRDALSYWRELGLTPKSLRAINDEALKEKKVDALTEALLELESGNSD